MHCSCYILYLKMTKKVKLYIVVDQIYLSYLQSPAWNKTCFSRGEAGASSSHRVPFQTSSWRSVHSPASHTHPLLLCTVIIRSERSKLVLTTTLFPVFLQIPQSQTSCHTSGGRAALSEETATAGTSENYIHFIKIKCVFRVLPLGLTYKKRLWCP